MKKLVLFLSVFLIYAQYSGAQTLADAVRYSLLDVGGTARTVGAGGAIGALGADFSVLSTNPAGAAAYRRSEFTFTPTFERSTISAKLEGEGNQTFEQDKANFNINNLGLVFASRPLDSKWRTSVFGIGINRVANFHQSAYFEGTSPGSVTDRWLELASGLNPSELDAFEAGPAYDAFAIYDPDAQNNYLSDFIGYNGGVNKSQLIRRKGAITELVFTFAGNYDEKLMIGGTIGVPILSFEETKTYMEEDPNDDVIFFDELTYTERLSTTGAGINLKLGLIYRVNQMARLGFAIHTPTGLGLDDSFSTELDYQYTDADGTQSLNAVSPEGNFEYRLRTPWRMIGSAGFIINKMGFLSAEVEYVDYTSAKFNFNNTTSTEDIIYEQELNRLIDDELASALNVRFGGEYAFEVFRLRAGYNLTADPFSDGSDTRGALSLGAGYRGENMFLDLAYKRLDNETEYIPYATANAPEQMVSMNEIRNRFMLTLGFKL